MKKKKTQTRKKQSPKKELNSENEFYIICSDCGGLGSIIISGSHEEVSNI